ncbi:MAG TPA: SRPBCC family protein [Ktedonobacterales bacterium]|jgi:uncharacterized protein YndB with AHSA1/START domain
MREGSAEVSIACPVEAAFAWLADPRHADEWFANVALPEPPPRPLRAGATWRFSMTRQRGRSIPMRLADYQPPHAFTWETTYPAWRSNLQWACALEPEPAARGEASGTARLRLTIRQRPGPLGWPALLLATLLGQLRVTEAASMPARAERAAQRAGEALEALPTTSYPAERRPPRTPRRGKGGKSKRR